MSFGDIVNEFPNLTVVKSMSKDFGIAGIRCGYSIMNSSRVEDLLKNGYLWNISGLASYFFKLYAQTDFQKEYEIVRKKYIMNTMMLISQLSEINTITIYPSRSNFVLIELPNNVTSFDFTIKLLVEHGVYVRDCSDKIGLEGNFIRLASRSFEENLQILEAIKQLLNKL
jgi:histidinol-phosphate/aromatic aminotransferase/cobyric acid decarboxylase-like protein